MGRLGWLLQLLQMLGPVALEVWPHIVAIFEALSKANVPQPSFATAPGNVAEDRKKVVAKMEELGIPEDQQALVLDAGNGKKATTSEAPATRSRNK